MSQHLDFLLLGATPFALVLLVLLLGLLGLCLRARGKSNRMNRAEFQQTGVGATTWDAYQGPTTQGSPTQEQREPDAKR